MDDDIIREVQLTPRGVIDSIPYQEKITEHDVKLWIAGRKRFGYTNQYILKDIEKKLSMSDSTVPPKIKENFRAIRDYLKQVESVVADKAKVAAITSTLGPKLGYMDGPLRTITEMAGVKPPPAQSGFGKRKTRKGRKPRRVKRTRKH